MARILKKGSLYLSLLAASVLAVALTAPSPAAAAEFCVNQQVNNVQKCWGPSQTLETAYATGLSTGVCVGEDLTQGQCTAVGGTAVVNVARGQHQPWVIGTASKLTYVFANAF